MYKRFPFLISLWALLMIGCETGEPTPAKVNVPSNLQIEELDGDEQRAFRKSNGFMVVEGRLNDGQKHGSWIHFYPQRRKIRQIENWVNGVKEGPLLEFSLNGNMELRAYYKDGELHGPYTAYKFGYLVEEATYDNGKLTGTRKKYYTSKGHYGKIQEVTEYVDGQQHGKHSIFNVDGEEIATYYFENGRRIEKE